MHEDFAKQGHGPDSDQESIIKLLEGFKKLERLQNCGSYQKGRTKPREKSGKMKNPCRMKGHNHEQDNCPKNYKNKTKEESNCVSDSEGCDSSDESDYHMQSDAEEESEMHYPSDEDTSTEMEDASMLGLMPRK